MLDDRLTERRRLADELDELPVVSAKVAMLVEDSDALGTMPKHRPQARVLGQEVTNALTKARLFDFGCRIFRQSAHDGCRRPLFYLDTPPRRLFCSALHVLQDGCPDQTGRCPRLRRAR